MFSTRQRQFAYGFLALLLVLVGFLALFVKGDGPILTPKGPAGDLSALLTGELMGFELTAPKPAEEATAFRTDTDDIKSLADYRGKIVLLNVWATWCAPCLNEMPTLDRLQQEMASDDFTVLAVSIDRDGLEKPKRFLERAGVEHLELLVDDTQKLAFTYNAYQLPSTILLDRQGREIGRMVGDTEWDSPEVKTFLKAVIEKTKAS